ncbi:MAG: trimethylamine methyltransferase family protein [Anaerolineae bacterium]
MKPTFRLLTDEQQSALAEAAFELLERVGVKLTESEAQALLYGAGARVEGDRVYIPASLAEEAIQSAPQGISIYMRDGELAMRLEGRNYYYGAHTDAPDVLDPFTYRRRPCQEDDVRRNAVLIDALPNLSYTTASGLVADRPPRIADRVSLAQCLKNSTKPVLAMPVTLRALADCRELAACAAGGEDALRAHPLLIVYSEPMSPLVHPDESVRKLLYCAEHEIPLVYTPYAAMGGTAPLSQAAIIAQMCAESLSGLVVHQLKRRGAPFIFGGMPSVMDMKTTIFSYGAPEFQLGNSLMAEMAHYFKLPNFGTAGTSDSQVFDGQAVLEATSSCIMAALSGANLVHDVGLLGNATVVMPDMIVATDEIINMTRRLLPEVYVNKEALALDVIRDVGPGGEFVTHPHTLHHVRDVWYPDLLYRGGAKVWSSSEQLSFEQRVNARTRTLMESHQPEPLSDDVVEQIKDIIRRAEEMTQ